MRTDRKQGAPGSREAVGRGPVAVVVLREPSAAAVRGASGWGWS